MATKAFLFAVIVICSKSPFTSSQEVPTTVRTNLGQITGRVRVYDNLPVHQFLGIRYAEPPVGNLRFARPQPVQPWPGDLIAQDFGAPCAQWTGGFRQVATNEDCLFLDVYVPRTLSPATRPRAVMIWIHGGGYRVGQGSGTDGSRLALHGDVIVVTVNYRLDVFGFLSTGDNECPGNFGLWDMNTAFRWVQDNIQSFGGDPGRVTLFGESAGAYAIGLHMLSEQSRGLFQRVILQSGGALTGRSMALRPVDFARRLSLALNCSLPNAYSSERLMTCLRARTRDEILRASFQVRTQLDSNLNFLIPIGPVVDHEYLTGTPEDLLNGGRGWGLPFQNVDLMAGVNSADGGLIIWSLRKFQRPLAFNLAQGIPSQVFCNRIAPAISSDYYSNSRDVAQAVCNEYSGGRGQDWRQDRNWPNSQLVGRGLTQEQQGREMINMYGDLMFTAPAIRTLRIHSDTAAERGTYMYLFSRESPLSNTRLTMPWFQGADHEEEVAYVFGVPLALAGLQPEDINLSRSMMTYWTNFASYGNPNGPTPNLPQWPEFGQTPDSGPGGRYLDLNATIRAETNLLPQRTDFWLDQIGLPRFIGGASSSRAGFITVGVALVLMILQTVMMSS